MNNRYFYRSSITGQIVSKAYAEANPNITTKEQELVKWTDTQVINIAAELSGRPEFSRTESPLILRIVQEAAKSLAAITTGKHHE